VRLGRGASQRESGERTTQGFGDSAVSAEPFLVHQGTQSCEAELVKTPSLESASVRTSRHWPEPATLNCSYGIDRVCWSGLIDLFSPWGQDRKARDLRSLRHLRRGEAVKRQCRICSDRLHGAPVSCQYSFEDLLALLHGHAPAKADAVAHHRRRVENGHLSVGLKIHCLDDGSQFATLVDGLGGAQKILEINSYKHSDASLCLVLPPVGSARSAILLLECIEHFTGSSLFSNPKIQIQVCSPGRLDARRSALLAIGFYLGSDTLRRYTLGELATSFAEHRYYPRGRRLVLYDAEGDFDRSFDWWTKDSGEHCCVVPHLPFESGRTDLLTGSGSRLDIENINFLATLLVHAQYQGYWSELGMQFQEEIEVLLERHLLSGLIEAPWVRTVDAKSQDDDRFFAALQELMAYAFEESVRIKKKGRRFPRWHEIPVRSSSGILQEVQSLLQKYRSELVRLSPLLGRGDPA
jgi:hypothetical protein